jgi:hypothetical protein
MDLHQITLVVSDGTGLTPDEVRLWGKVTAVVAVASLVLHAAETMRRMIYSLGDG